MNVFEERFTRSYQLPMNLAGKLRRQMDIVLRFNPGKSIDFGGLCFLNRSSKRRKRQEGVHVQLASFNEQRSKHVADLIKQVNSEASGSGTRLTTIYSNWYLFVKFIDWCDANGHRRVLCSKFDAGAAFSGKTAEVLRRADQHQINQNTAAHYQGAIASILKRFFQDDGMLTGTRVIPFSTRLKGHTPVPSEDLQANVLSLCMCLFNGALNIVLGDREDGLAARFPYALKVPPYLNRPHDRIWLFPIRLWKEYSEQFKYTVYDFDRGALRSFDEIKAMFPSRTNSDIRRSIRSANSAMDKVNNERFHPVRMRHGALGMSAFRTIFLAATAINEAQAADLPWNEELEAAVSNPESERQGFRAIKYRAGGRLVSFEIGVEYMPSLRSYLSLRKTMLRGVECDYLFFVWDGKDKHPRKDEGNEQMLAFSGSLVRIDPNLRNLGSRAWRVAKQDHLMRVADPVTAARLLQHSLSTTLRAYSNGSEVLQQSEMSAYLKKVEGVVIRRAGTEAGQQRAIGNCARPLSPSRVSENVPVQPDCLKAEGCLFCDKYRLHADGVDARKILSARHCVRVVARYSYGNTGSSKATKDILDRIEGVLNELRRHNLKLVEKIESEVDVYGELDAYWAAKLETLMALGMEIL